MSRFTNTLKAMVAMVAGAFVFAGAALAAPTIGFDQADNSTLPVGTSVNVTGNAGGTTGGLDLVLVLDSSGSMSASAGNGQSRRDVQAAAAIALVNSLPAGTRVSVVDFDGSASVVQGLTVLGTQANLDAVIAAINGVNASGGTNIASGINAAASELTANTIAGVSQQIILISDGGSSQSAAVTAATNAVTAGIASVTTVGLPGTNVPTMTAIATAGNGQFIDVTGDPSALVGIFTGTGGNLVNIASASVTLPDGTVVALAVDGLGNFAIPAWVIALGDNIFSVTATDTTGASTTLALTLVGVMDTPPTNPVPLPAAAWFMMAGIGAYGASKRKKKAA